jgi:hypothetical protein
MMAETNDHQSPGVPFAHNVQSDHAAYEKQPADHDGYSKCRQRRYDYCQEAEQHEDDAFGKEQPPVLAHRFGHGTLGGTEITLTGGGHGRLRRHIQCLVGCRFSKRNPSCAWAVAP